MAVLDELDEQQEDPLLTVIRLEANRKASARISRMTLLSWLPIILLCASAGAGIASILLGVLT
jgi:hypothetical protein